jgi:alpha-N-arabinofuranosidase
MGFLGKIRIAFDEWNLRGWHHPHRWSATEDYLTPRGRNDENASYTMADAVFSACFLNQCLKHCQTVRMANFAPLVNTRGLIYSHETGIVLRSAYHVFALFSHYMGETVVDSWIENGDEFQTGEGGDRLGIPALDAAATISAKANEVAISLVNRHPESAQHVAIRMRGLSEYGTAEVHTLAGATKDSYNGVDNPRDVTPQVERINLERRESLALELPPHSVSVIRIRR